MSTTEVMGLDQRQFPEGSLLSQVIIRGERPGGLLEAEVPMDLICHEDVAVDEEHVALLRDAIAKEAAERGGSGQESPSLLGEVRGLKWLLIIDGFHRDAALQALARDITFATIRPNSTLDDITDQRILAANRHSAVVHARTPAWINETWLRTDWAARYPGLSIVQAFGLAATSSSGRKLGISSEDAAAIIAWVEDKSNKWQLGIRTIHTMLRSAAIAAPELVKTARGRASGRGLDTLTPQHVQAIARELPLRYAVQREVARAAVAHSLTIPQARAIARNCKLATTEDAAREILEAVDWTVIEPVMSKTRATHRPRATERAAATIGELSRALLLSELALGRSALGNLVLGGKYTAPSEQPALPTLRVHYTDDEEVTALALPQIAKPSTAEAFSEFIAKSRPRIIEQICAKHSVSVDEAAQLIEASMERIVRDMRQGDLRHVRQLQGRAFLDLFNRCLFDELRKRKDVKPQQAAGPGSESLPVVIDLSTFLSSFPDLPRIVCRYIIRRSILDLSTPTIRKLAYIPDGEGSAMEEILSNPGPITARLLKAEQAAG